MSRSYKHTPVNKDGNRSKKWGKNQANRRVRRYKYGLSNGMSYKNLYDRWDICDCRWYGTLADKFYWENRWVNIWKWGFKPYGVKPKEEIIKEWKTDFYWK